MAGWTSKQAQDKSFRAWQRSNCGRCFLQQNESRSAKKKPTTYAEPPVSPKSLYQLSDSFRQIACQPGKKTLHLGKTSYRMLILYEILFYAKSYTKKKKKREQVSSRDRPHHALYPHRLPESLTFFEHILRPFQHKSILDAPSDVKELSQILLGLVFFLVFNGLADQFESVN